MQEKKEKRIFPYFIGIGFDEKFRPELKNMTGFENEVQVITALDVVKNKLTYEYLNGMVDVKLNKLLLELSNLAEDKEVKEKE